MIRTRACPDHSPSLKKLRAGTEAGAEVKPWRSVAHWLASGILHLIYHPVQSAQGGTAPSRLSPAISADHQENAIQTCLQANLIEAIFLFSTEFSPSLPTLVSVKLSKPSTVPLVDSNTDVAFPSYTSVYKASLLSSPPYLAHALVYKFLFSDCEAPTTSSTIGHAI